MTKPPEKPRAHGAIDDPDAPPTDAELALAAELRAALESAPNDTAATRAHDDAALLRSLALSHEPRAIDEAEHRALVEKAVAKLDETAARAPARRGNVVRVTFGIAGALALAASVALLVRTTSSRQSTVAVSAAPAAPMAAAPAPARAKPDAPSRFALPRSTQELFDAPFATASATAHVSSGSARIDRIAAARRSDLRENRFARWGVQ